MTIIDSSDFYAKRDSLKQVQIDGENWLIYYIDEKSDEKWVKKYPNSHAHDFFF